jgi:hypothetical protein
MEPAPGQQPTIPAIPLLVFAAIDLLVAFVLLVNSGFTWAFALIAGIGIVLAALGLWGVYRGPAADV